MSYHKIESVYQYIEASKVKGQKILVVLIDPDKLDLNAIKPFIDKVNASMATLIFVGGSEVKEALTSSVVEAVKRYTTLPVILFPGDITQVAENADALLFLSLLSGRNPDYLIGKQIEAVSRIRDTALEVIPTGYILIENGKTTSVERVTKTKPIPRTDIEQVVDTAIAGQYLGMQLIYLEAGSGAQQPVPLETIARVKSSIKIPLIVGGGITSRKVLDQVYHAGADIVVIGTVLEKDNTFFNDIKA